MVRVFRQKSTLEDAIGSHACSKASPLSDIGQRVILPFLHSNMPVYPTHVRLNLLHACGHWHSSRKVTPLTGSHCKLRPNTEGTQDRRLSVANDKGRTRPFRRVWCREGMPLQQRLVFQQGARSLQCTPKPHANHTLSLLLCLDPHRPTCPPPVLSHHHCTHVRFQQ
jgi:hypothetical protein